MIRFFAFGLLLVLMSAPALAQERLLADQYFQNGEFEKAGQLYLKLYTEQPVVDQYFERYIECLTAVNEFEVAETILRKEIRQRPKVMQYYISLATVYKLQDRIPESEAAYNQAIDVMPPDQAQIVRLANALVRDLNYELATSVYAKGAKLLNNPYVFAFYLGDLYRRAGDNSKMIEQYLLYLQTNPKQQSTVQMMMLRYLPETEYAELQAQLYQLINDHPEDEILFIEMLTWSYLQQKDYRNALRQVKALDQKLDEPGTRVYDLGLIAANERDLEPAIEAFSYVTEMRGVQSPYYYDSKKQLLKVKRLKVLADPVFHETELINLEKEYQLFIDENGRNRLVAPIMIELAELQALYLRELDTSIILLEEVIALPGLPVDVQSEAKLNLGDYYLIRGDIWDATLLFSQVDKRYGDDPLGHEARFRNARLAYFNRDFEWAQSQFSVLKASTSKLIANDALDLSIFIMDNLGLDTTLEAMGLYADAELLVFQNRHDEAFNKLDSLSRQFPNHSLEDDILYLKAQIYRKDRQFEKAIVVLQRIVDEFSEEIRADNAVMQLGDLYSGPLNDASKAMLYYEKLFTDYDNSTFALEARKQYRKLRGDSIQ